MVKRKRNKKLPVIFNSTIDTQNSISKIDTNINKTNIDVNCSKELFSINFSKWMNEIFHDIQINNDDKSVVALMLIKRAEHCHGDMCKQYFSDHASNLVNYVVGSTNTEKSVQLRLKVLLICLQNVPSIFGPFKNKIQAFLLNLLKSNNTNMEESMSIFSKCISYLPILGSGGTNNQNHVISWNTEFDLHLNRLDQILDLTKHDVTFSIHCLSIINLLKLNLHSQVKIPIQRILDTVAKVLNYGANEEQFRKINVAVKIQFTLDILALLEGLIVELGDLLWTHADIIFNFLIKFLRFSNDLATSNSLKCKLKCQIYSVISNCLLTNYSCKLQSILMVIRDSAILDSQPQYLNEVDISFQTLENSTSRNKKRKHQRTEPMNMVASSTTTNNDNLSFKVNYHDWLDFEALELACLAALKVLKAISAMDPFLINSEKNESTRNRVELMIPIWKFTVETLIKLDAFKDGIYPYASAECRLSLFSLMQQHISDHMFYTSRFCGRAYIAMCGGNFDSDLRIRLLCHNAIATYNQFCSLRTIKLNSTSEQILPMEQDPIGNSMFLSCRNTTLNDSHLSLINNECTIDVIESLPEKVTPVKVIDPNQFLDISQNDNYALEGNTSVTLSFSQYSDAEMSLNNSKDTNISIIENIPNDKIDIEYSVCKDTSTSAAKIDTKIKDGFLDDIFKDKTGAIQELIDSSQELALKQSTISNANSNKNLEIDFMLASFVDADPD